MTSGLDPRAAFILEHPDDFEGFSQRFPDATRDAWRSKRTRLRAAGLVYGEELRPRSNTPSDMPGLLWDKAEIDFHWSDVLKPLEEMQRIAKAASGSQDRAHFRIETDRSAPVLFISDWHIGSWGTSYRKIAEITELIRTHRLWVAVLGDMLQLAIKLRNVLEVSDNAIPPRLQMRFLGSWLEDLAPHILWSTWDNHGVMREEAVTGFSMYAELFKEKTVYHSGIGHVDLEVGEETYRIATSHRFRGNSYLNPTHGQMRYGRFEGLDRELIVAGDSHRPAIQTYTDGPMTRVAINCGTLQTDSGYAKRWFSLNTHDWMPLVVFMPDKHLMVPFADVSHYLAMRDEEVAA